MCIVKRLNELKSMYNQIEDGCFNCIHARPGFLGYKCAIHDVYAAPFGKCFKHTIDADKQTLFLERVSKINRKMVNR